MVLSRSRRCGRTLGLPPIRRSSSTLIQSLQSLQSPHFCVHNLIFSSSLLKPELPCPSYPCLPVLITVSDDCPYSHHLSTKVPLRKIARLASSVQTASPIVMAHLQVVIILVRKGHGRSSLHLLLVLLEQGLVDLGSGRGQSRGSDEFLNINC